MKFDKRKKQYGYLINDIPMLPTPDFCNYCSESYRDSNDKELPTNKKYKMSAVNVAGFICCENCGRSYGHLAS